MRTDPGPHESAGTNVQRVAAEARASVSRALARLEGGERNALDDLRDAVCAFVLALRTGGASRDDAIEAVRSAMSPSGSADESSILPPAREALVELSIHWCADQYGAE